MTALPISLSQLQHIFQYGCAVLSCVFNIVLIILVVRCSPKKTGNYKYLIIYISVYQMLFSLLQVVVEPQIFTDGPTTLLFTNVKDSNLPRMFWLIMSAILCGCFGFTISLLAIHIIYRYYALKGLKSGVYLECRGWIYLFLIPPLITTFWVLNNYFLLSPDMDTTAFVRHKILMEFDLNVDHIEYIHSHYYRPKVINNDVTHYLHTKTFIGIINNVVLTIIILANVVLFAILCCLRMKKIVRENPNSSTDLKKQNHQLIQALMFQSAIPFFLLCIPSANIILGPYIFFGKYLPTNFIIITGALLPALDPLPSILIIKAYRRCLFGVLCPWREVKVERKVSKKIERFDVI